MEEKNAMEAVSQGKTSLECGFFLKECVKTFFTTLCSKDARPILPLLTNSFYKVNFKKIVHTSET